MGGAETEISLETTDVLIESAQFAPLPVRSAARALVLGSPSSYRFERGPDPAAVEWASCRAVELILDLAGGTCIAAPAIKAGSLSSSQATIDLRTHRVEQVLGVSISGQRQREILQSLGFVEQESASDVPRVGLLQRGDVTVHVKSISLRKLLALKGMIVCPRIFRYRLFLCSVHRVNVWYGWLVSLV